MRPNTLSYATNQFWTDLASRLEPLIGNVEISLGRSWMDAVEAGFSRWDFLAIETAKRTRGKAPDWYILEWHEAAHGYEGDDDWLVAGESREECIAHLVERCQDRSVWPTACDHDERSDRTTFKLDETTFAVIRPVRPSQPVDAATRSRVEGTLIALRKHGNPHAEFAKRLARWPGLSVLHAEDRANFRAPSAHWPCPAEWLMSARLLWAKAGTPEPSTSQAQQLAAAVTGFPTWNHLCGLMPSSANDDDWWSLSSPYYVYGTDPANHETNAVFRGPVEAFLAFRSSAAQVCAGLDAAQARFSATVPGSPWLSIDPTIPTNPSFEQLCTRGLVTLMPTNAALFESATLDHVRSVLKEGYANGLSSLLVAL